MIDDDKDTRTNVTSQAFEEARDLKPSSELEKQRLLDSLAKPKKTMEYTPQGTVEKTVHQGLDDDKRARIKAIEERLGRARDEKGMKRSFDKKR